MNKGLDFRYVLFKDVEKLNELHPLVHDQDDRFEYLRYCPDIHDEFPCYFYLTDEKRTKIISSIGCIPDTLSFNDKRYQWAWSESLFTDSEYRGKGLATELITKQVRVLHGKGYAWGGVFSTDNAIRIYQRLGFVVPGYASRYLLIRNPQPFLRKYIGNHKLLGAINWVFRGASKLPFAFLRYLIEQKKDFVIEETDYDDGNLMNLFDRRINRNNMCFNNSIEKIRWKMRRRNVDKLYIVSNKFSYVPLFYLVVRDRIIKNEIAGGYKDFNLMTLMDYGYFSSDNKLNGFLISAVVLLFLQSKGDILEVISSSPEIAYYARRYGMFRVGKGMSFKFCAPNNWELSSMCHEISDWHLTHYCGDAYSFE